MPPLRRTRRLPEYRDFGRQQRPVLADFKIPDRNQPDARAHQFQYFGAQGFHHPPDLTVAAFGDGDFKERVFLGIADAVDDGGARGAIREYDAFAQLIQLFVA